MYSFMKNLFFSFCFILLINSLFIRGQDNAKTDCHKTDNFWEKLLPAPMDGGFRIDDYWVWGGSVIKGEDGEYRTMRSTERPQILVEDGKATHVFFATQNPKGDRRHTWCMCIPLKPKEAVKDRLERWREARFGMFIHWGLYAIPGGICKGDTIKHDGRFPNPYCEHIMYQARILIAEYKTLADKFNPQNFNAEAVVRMAKNTGMKYIVFTSKHHDGFAMYNSDISGYNIVDATPFGRDPLKELSEACKKENIKLGIYYSVGRDWHHPDAISKRTNDWDFQDSANRNYQKYLDEKVKPQLEEILSNYGKIAILWFDTPEQTTLKQSIDLELFVKRLQPEIIVNTRVGNKVGDYKEMRDNRYPESSMNIDWETPATMAKSWGYSQFDTEKYWKDTDELLKNLLNSVSHGGNYLLNIGPDALGNVLIFAIERLEQIAAWMKINGEAVYGA